MPCDANAGAGARERPRAMFWRTYLLVCVAFWTYYLLCELFMLPLARPQVLNEHSNNVTENSHDLFIIILHSGTIHNTHTTHIQTRHNKRIVFLGNCWLSRLLPTQPKIFTFRNVLPVTVMRMKGSIYQHQFSRLPTISQKWIRSTLDSRHRIHSTLNLIDWKQFNWLVDGKWWFSL